MGYQTTYNLDISPFPESELKWLIQTNDILSYVYNHGYETKWYNHEKDMVELSKKFPEYLFTLDGQGEGQGDVWRKYFKGGLMQVWRMSPQTPDPFDPKKLKEIV